MLRRTTACASASSPNPCRRSSAQLQRRCPGKRYAIGEARNAIGGTWDLFRYPGIRSD